MTVPTDVSKNVKVATYRCQLKLAADCSNLSFGFANLIKNGFLIPSTNGPITIKCSLEIGVELLPIYFSGNREAQIEPGATLFSDPLSRHVAASDRVFIRTYVACTNGTPISLVLFGASHGWGNDSYSLSDNVDQTNVSSFVTQFDQRDGYGPSSIIATPDLHLTTATIVGNSIATGAGDAPCGDGRNFQPLGYMERALLSQGIPWVIISTGGDTASNFVSTSQWRMPLAPGSQVALSDYGINDIGAKYNESVDFIKSRLLSIWQMLAARNKEVYQTTLLPQTYQNGPTDFWTSLTNQVPTSSKVAALNSWLRDLSTNGAVCQSGGTLTGVIDVASLVELSNRWAVPVAPIYSGKISSLTSNTISDIDCKIFVPGELANGAVIKIVSGDAAGQLRLITQNTATNFIVSQPWPATISAGQNYELWIPPTVDGTHPTASTHKRLAQSFPNLVRPTVTLIRLPSGMHVQWEAAEEYELETSTDLAGAWQPITTFGNEAHTLDDSPKRFYRLHRKE